MRAVQWCGVISCIDVEHIQTSEVQQCRDQGRAVTICKSG